eukprot:scaffold210185_cov43-Prasinocladus_malaysianus.AAC.1
MNVLQQVSDLDWGAHDVLDLFVTEVVGLKHDRLKSRPWERLEAATQLSIQFIQTASAVSMLVQGAFDQTHKKAQLSNHGNHFSTSSMSGSGNHLIRAATSSGQGSSFRRLQRSSPT